MRNAGLVIYFGAIVKKKGLFGTAVFLNAASVDRLTAGFHPGLAPSDRYIAPTGRTDARCFIA